MPKKWILPPDRPDEVRQLADALRVAELTARLLVDRGQTEPGAAQRFLQPSLHELVDPCDDEAMTEAARFLLDAVRSGRHVTVFGDYDADGICAAALLMRCFAFWDAPVDLSIPHRVDEGYGLSREALKELADGGTEVVVTVDCGVSSVDEAAYARELGMDMVITDHHEPGPELPDAVAVLNPKLPDRTFGFRMLAGVGVAFKLVWAIGQELSPGHRVSQQFKDFLMEALSLVAVGSVADVVPLVDENRVLVSYGLRALSAAPTPGMKALMTAGRVRGSRVTSEDIGFRIAPRLNAAGRMGDARSAVELATTTDPARAADLAEHIEQENRLRISTQRAVLKEAEKRLADDESLLGNSIVLADAGWHQGVVGLAASRLADRHWRPTFILSIEGDLACGSGRSVPGFPLLSVLTECADLLDRFGGHEAAAGLTLPVENLPAFAERFDSLAAQFLGREQPVPELQLDGEVLLAELSPALVKEMDLLQPFGKGNPEPAFAASGLRMVGNPRLMGSTQAHLSFMVRQDRTTLRVIGMRKAEWLDELLARKGEELALAFTPGLDTYRGTMAVELRAHDLQWHDARLTETR